MSTKNGSGWITVFAVFHSTKVEGLAGEDPRIGANPPMTIEGMKNILKTVEVLKQFGPFNALYSSRMARCTDAASVIAYELNTDFITVAGLGQNGNLDQGQVIMYPGHDGESFTEWQRNAVAAMQEICKRHKPGDKIIITGHRPTIGALVAAAWDFTNQTIESVVKNPDLTKNGYVVLRCKFYREHFRISVSKN